MTNTYAILIGYFDENKLHVLHMVMYEEMPNMEEILNLKKEIENDQEFNYIFKINNNIEYIKCTLKENVIITKEKIEF